MCCSGYYVLEELHICRLLQKFITDSRVLPRYSISSEWPVAECLLNLMQIYTV